LDPINPKMENLRDTATDAVGHLILEFVGVCQAAQTRRVSKRWFAATASPADCFKTMFFHERNLGLLGQTGSGVTNLAVQRYGSIVDSRPDLCSRPIVFQSNKGIVKFIVTSETRIADSHGIILVLLAGNVAVAEEELRVPRRAQAVFDALVSMALLSKVRPEDDSMPIAICVSKPPITDVYDPFLWQGRPYLGRFGRRDGDQVFHISTWTGEHFQDAFLWQAQQLTPFGDELRFL
jgi:hypothetical protein